MAVREQTGTAPPMTIHVCMHAGLPLLLIALSGCGDRESRAQRASASAESRAHQPSISADAPTELSSAADVIRRYYEAIGRGQYDTAYALWEDAGSASGQTLAQF